MTQTADDIVSQKIVSIAQQDGVYQQGDSIAQMLEKIRVKRRQRGKNVHSYNPIGESKNTIKKRQEIEKLAVGSKVHWESQINGSVKRKEGTIMAYVPRGTKVPLEGLDIPVSSRMKFNPAFTTAFDRYLIAVLEKRTIRYFAPRASSVSIAVEP